MAARAISTISKPYGIRAGNPLFTINMDWAALPGWKAPRGYQLGRELARLSVRLISL